MKRYLSIFAACLIAAALAISGCRSPDNSEPQDNIEYTITVDPSSNGRVFAGLDKAEAGTEISLIIRANSGYELTSLTAIPANKVSFTGDGSKRTFIMPDADVRIYAVFDFLPPNFYSVNVNGNDAEKGAVSANKTSYEANDPVTLTLTEENGYELDTISATAGDALFPIGTRTGDTWTFAMPAVNINVTVSWKEITKYNVNIGNFSGGRVFASPDKAAAGAEISLSIDADTGYQLTSLTVAPADAVSITGDGTTRTFIMPDTDVGIYAVFNLLPPNFYSVIINGNDAEKGAVSADKTAYKANDPVILTLREENSYELDTISATAGSSPFDMGTRTGDTWTFTMPANNVNITVSWRIIPQYNINIGNFSGGIVFAGPNPAEQGQTVTLTVTEDTNYTLHSLSTIPDNLGVMTGMRTFIMPAQEVTVNAEFIFNPLPPENNFQIIEDFESFTGAGDRNFWVDQGTLSISPNPQAQGNKGMRLTHQAGNERWYGGAGKGAPITLHGTEWKAISFWVRVENAGAYRFILQGADGGGNDGDADYSYYFTIDRPGVWVKITAPAGEIQNPAGQILTGTAVGWVIAPLNTPAGWIDIDNICYEGDGSPAPTYEIIFGSMSNGGVSASPNPAKMGETVRLTASPAGGYQLDAITTNPSQNLTVSGDNIRTFTMPAEAVTVNAVFVQQQTSGLKIEKFAEKGLRMGAYIRATWGIPASTQPPSGQRPSGWSSNPGWTADQIKGEYLTDLMLSFAVQTSANSGLSFSTGNYLWTELAKLKQQYPHLRINISVGGWSGSKYFSDMANNSAYRANFVNSCINFIRDHNLDGMDIDWEYPVTGGDSGNSKGSYDKANWVTLLRELREALTTLGSQTGKYYYLSTCVPVSSGFVSSNDPQLATDYVDSLTLMAYDAAGSWTNAMHDANLYATSGAQSYSTDRSVRDFRNKGAPAGSIMVGFPAYGKQWTVASGLTGTRPGYNTKNSWVGNIDVYYPDIKNLVNAQGYTRYWDDEAKAPFLYNSSNGRWISYCDAQMLQEIAKYVKQNNLGGMFFWEYAGDMQGELTKAAYDALVAEYGL